MAQHFLLVWLDANFNEADIHFQNSIKTLHVIASSIDTFTDVQKCVDYLNKVKEEKVFMIASGSLSQEIIPKIESLPQIESIYILCGDKAVHKQWATKIPKVKGVYTKIEPICEALKMERKICNHNMISISLNRVDPLFMYTQLLKDAIMQIEDNDDEQLNKLVDFCHQQDDINPEQIKRIQTQYRQHDAIWWYTAETFLYSMLNLGLREMNTDIILNMQFFIRHLHQHIAELYKKQKQATSSLKIPNKFTVYRGQGLSKKVFEQLKSEKGELMSFNNFLSTSLDRQVSLRFASKSSSGMVGILFVMAIDSRVAEASNIPYADVSEVGYYKGKEAEILFTTHTIFRINHIQRMTDDQSNRLWEVQLTLTGNTDHELSKLMTHFQSERGDEGWGRVGIILLQMGKPEKAKQLYQALLARATTERERAVYLNQLGRVYDERGKYGKAVEFYESSLKIKEKILSPNDPGLATAYHNIGSVYDSMGDYSRALELYQKSLDIMKIALPPNHRNLATSYTNLGNVYYSMSEYSRALESHQKSLEIMKIALPQNHPDLAGFYNNIGLVYNGMGEYSKALESHQKSLDIMRITLPPNHPDLASSYGNIGNVYDSMGAYQKALESHQKSLEIKEMSLSPNHPDLAQSYMGIGLVYSNMGEYTKALESHQKSLGIMKITLRPNHPDLASSYNNIGSTYGSMGEYSKAVEYYLKSLEIMKMALPPNHPDFANSYNNIGSAYSSIGEYSKAVECYQKSLEIMKITFSPNQPELASAYNNIGNVYKNTGEYSKALEYYQKSLEIIKIALTPNHPHVAMSYNNIGVVYENLKDYEKALLYYRKTLAVFEESLQPGHPHIAKVEINIERVKSKM